MKKAIFLSILITAGCSDDKKSNQPTESDFELSGEYVSNCFTVIDEDDLPSGYVISKLIFNGGSYEEEGVYHVDETCTEIDGEMDSFYGEYEIGDKINTTDGVDATLVSFTRNSDDWPEGLPPYQLVIRIDNGAMNVGYYQTKEVPELNYDITYTKQ